MIRGAHDGQNIIVTDYKEEDLEAIFKTFFKPEQTSGSSWYQKKTNKVSLKFFGINSILFYSMYT